MTIEEIFSHINGHMIEGLMIHSQLSDYFGFLGLDGYQEYHKYHYFEESNNYKKLCNYYIHHYNKLIIENSFKNPNIIPSSWHQYTRHDVDETTRKNSIQAGFERWVNWEKETKKLYETLYQELINLREVASAEELTKYIIDVDAELAEACQKYIELNAINYDISTIIQEQEEYKKEYQNKLKEVFND